MGSRHMLPIDNAGLHKKIMKLDGAEEAAVAEFLPIKEITVAAEICDSMSTVKIT